MADVIRDKITTKMDKIEPDFASAIVRISMLRGSFSSILYCLAYWGLVTNFLYFSQFAIAPPCVKRPFHL